MFKTGLYVATALAGIGSGGMATLALSHVSSVGKEAGSNTFVCNYATTVVRAGAGAPVYRRPAAESKIVARLPGDAPVYICDEDEHWYQVYFNRACAARVISGLVNEFAHRCSRGWMRKSQVEVRSG